MSLESKAHALTMNLILACHKCGRSPAVSFKKQQAATQDGAGEVETMLWMTGCGHIICRAHLPDGNVLIGESVTIHSNPSNSLVEGPSLDQRDERPVVPCPVCPSHRDTPLVSGNFLEQLLEPKSIYIFYSQLLTFMHMRCLRQLHS